jgi:hypothetical protein
MSIHSLWRVYPVIMTYHKCLHLGSEFYKVTLFRTKVIQIQPLFKNSRVKMQVLSFWTWALKQYCRVWKTLQLSFWAFLHSDFSLMGNFALQKGPYNFLKLRISPWGNLFILLLCFFSPRCLYPFSISTGGSSIQLLLFLPLSLFPFLSRQRL